MATNNGAGPEVFIVDACRTPVGRYRGVLSGVRPDDLGAIALRGLLDRNPGLPPDAVEDVIFGAANQAGEDNRNVARMSALLAGLPIEVGGSTVNRLCGSGLEAVNQITAGLRCGIGDVAIAGGVEAMSRAPFVLPRADERLQRKQELFDTVLGWRLVNPKMPGEETIPMGATAEVLAGELNISREDQDRFALESHRRAVAAQQAGAFDAELIPVTPPGDNAAPVTADEGPRADTTLEKLAKLRPAFAADGTVTAGSASQISDGAAAVVVMSKAKAEELGLEWLAEIGAHGVVAGPDASLQLQPANAIKKAVSREGIDVSDLDLVEINEAFAAVGIASTRALGLDIDKVNVNGGAIAMGHPIGMSGARLALHLALELKRRGGGVGAAALCGGGGQGDALIIRVPKA